MSEAVGRPLGACEEEMPALACVVLMGWLWGAGVLESRTAPRKLRSLQQPGNGGGGGGERVFTENCALSVVVESCPPQKMYWSHTLPYLRTQPHLEMRSLWR